MSNHSPNFDLAKRKYDSGAWTKAAIRQLAIVGRITAEEYTEITGEAF